MTRFDWNKGDIIITRNKISVPAKLRPVVRNAPRSRAGIDRYLQKLLSMNAINDSDFTFLVESGVLLQK